MILVMNPLHYKTLVTKKRLHITFNGMFIFLILEFAIGIVLFRHEKYIDMNECLLAYILKDLAYIIMAMVTFVIFICTMLISYIYVTVKLMQRRRQFRAESGSIDINSKVMKACWLALSAFLMMYTPSVLLTLVSNFMVPPYPLYYLVLLDITFLMFFVNNFINPFLYFYTLNDFREGYKNLLACRKIQMIQRSNLVSHSGTFMSSQKSTNTQV